MDHTLFPEHTRFFSKYMLKDEEGWVYTDKLRFYVLDLTQIETATEEQKQQGLVEWAKAFRARSWDEVNKIQNSGVKEAAGTMRVIMTNATEREMLRYRQAAEYDWNTLMRDVRNAEQKVRDAEQKTREAERKTVQVKAEMARVLKSKGVDLDTIAISSGLTLEEINAL